MVIPRGALASLRLHLRAFPVVLVAGPRQAGKTTLVRSALPGWKHLDLENPADFSLLSSDPQGFFAANPGRVSIDEVQRMPELFPVLRSAIDRRRRPGSFVLTGSAAPGLLRQGGETLAGRIGLLELTPFGSAELAARPKWLAQRWFWGGFPPLYALRGPAEKTLWLEQFIATFLERDIPGLGISVPAARLRRLWTMLSHVHGGLLNASDICRSLDIGATALNHHLDILEGAFMIRRLQPYHANVAKRLVKSPKLYIRDTGLLHHLAGLRSPQDLETWPGRGNSWEGFVVEELIRRARERWPSPRFWFWRTQAGAETDLLIEVGRTLIPIEIKASASPAPKSLLGVRQCVKDLSLKHGFVVYRGDRTLSVAPDVTAIPWASLEKGGLPGD
ncbi:MAG: ATP-binding protein [Elusimicrobia bacterium]|nr:ATP-binding protein [Elusimicrobiota bacterium]